MVSEARALGHPSMCFVWKFLIFWWKT